MTFTTKIKNRLHSKSLKLNVHSYIDRIKILTKQLEYLFERLWLDVAKKKKKKVQELRSWGWHYQESGEGGLELWRCLSFTAESRKQS